MLDEIRTLPDKLLHNVEIFNTAKKVQIKLNYLAEVTHVTLKKAEYWIEFLEKQGLVEVIYPINVFATPKVRYLNKKKASQNYLALPDAKEKLAEYDIESDKLIANVRIWKVPSEDVSIYELVLPKIGPGTTAFLLGLLDEITKHIPISTDEVNDPKKMKQFMERSFDKLCQEIKQRLPEEKQEIINTLGSILLHKMYGLDEIDVFLADDQLEELAINGADQPISVYHKKYGWLKTLHIVSSENEIFNIASQIGRKSGQQINSLNPIMDARLLTGDRVASTIYPISTNGNTITIRRFSRKPWTVTQFVSKKRNLFSKEIAAFIWMAMQYELNVLIAGGTASGKTSMLNVLCSLIQPTNRVITIEDTREIALPQSLYWNWVPLNSRLPNPEGQGEISMLDLIVASLRMRPDRIIVGEIRRKQQAQALFEAMHTGHSVYATMHADTAHQVKKRLLEPPIEVPKTELGSLHLIVMQFRDRKTGRRRTLEVAEVIDLKDDIELNYLYRWHPRSDTFEKVNESKRIYEDLSLHTGLTPRDIEQDLREKEAVLQWMVDNSLEDVNQVGQVMRIYYKDKDFLIKSIRSKSSLPKILEKFEAKYPGEKLKKRAEEPHTNSNEIRKFMEKSRRVSGKKANQESGNKEGKKKSMTASKKTSTKANKKTTSRKTGKKITSKKPDRKKSTKKVKKAKPTKTKQLANKNRLSKKSNAKKPTRKKPTARKPNAKNPTNKKANTKKAEPTVEKYYD